MRILLIAPYYNKNVPGESWSTFKWVEGICKRHECTILTTHHKGWNSDDSPTGAKNIVNWTDPKLPRRFAQLNRELKPTYPLFYLRARHWLKKALKAGEHFDLVHQINPLALRYPSPAQGLGLKYIMGPLAGSLQTPEGFRSESNDKKWYRKLRNLDAWRIKYDPWLSKTYNQARLILGVAPYVQELLASAGISDFAFESETGVESLNSVPKICPESTEPLRLLFVGRVIRTKGVIDAIRAVAIASKQCNIKFDILGDGDMLNQCKSEAEKLEVSHIVHFHGRVARETVSQWYKKAHVFLFPSFREPSGNVVFEALGNGLPVITSTSGGPGYVVTDHCGIRINPTTPNQYAKEIAIAITRISNDRENISRYSKAALDRMKKLALWDQKSAKIDAIYQELLSG